MRVVLDTNIFLSALLSERGPPATIVDAWRAGRFELVSSLDQINEFKRELYGGREVAIHFSCGRCSGARLRG